jgi:hypothetical protein
MRREQPSGLDGVVSELILTAYFYGVTLPYATIYGSGPVPSGRD